MPRSTSKTYLDILDAPRQEIFRTLSKLPRGGILGGDTALALQIGHRSSFDFDFFYGKHIKKEWLHELRRLFGSTLVRPVVDNEEELTVLLEPNIKLTLLHYPFPNIHKTNTINGIYVLHPYDIATAKAYAIGRRGAWRDYVDIYFLLWKSIVTLERMIKEAKERFGGSFDEKLFLQQLVYFNDITDTTVEMIVNVDEEEIKNFLEKTVREYMDIRIKNF